MAVIWAAFWAVITRLFEDPPAEEDPIQLQNVENVVTPTGSADRLAASATSTQPESLSMTRGQIGSLICMCWLAMTCFFVLGELYTHFHLRYGA